MVEEGRADEEAFLVPLQVEAAAVDDQLAALVGAHLDVMLDLRLVRGGDHRAVMRVGIGRDADPKPSIAGISLARRASAVLSPTGTTTGSAMQRSPALPKAAPARSLTTWSRSASGMTMPWFLAPPNAWTRLPLAVPRAVDILRDVAAADEAHRLDVGMVEDRVDHFLVAVDDVEDAVGQARFLHQFGQAHRHARVALAEA